MWSKRSWEVPKSGLKYTKPTVISRELEQRNLAQIRGINFNSSYIDNSGENGIIKSEVAVASNAHSCDIELETIIQRGIKQDKPVFADNLASNFAKIPPEKVRYIISMHGTPNSVFL